MQPYIQLSRPAPAFELTGAYEAVQPALANLRDSLRGWRIMHEGVAGGQMYVRAEYVGGDRPFTAYDWPHDSEIRALELSAH